MLVGNETFCHCVLTTALSYVALRNDNTFLSAFWGLGIVDNDQLRAFELLQRLRLVSSVFPDTSELDATMNGIRGSSYLITITLMI